MKIKAERSKEDFKIYFELNNVLRISEYFNRKKGERYNAKTENYKDKIRLLKTKTISFQILGIKIQSPKLK